MALNHKTSFRRDETGDLDVKTAIYFPAKSMVKDSIEVNCNIVLFEKLCRVKVL